MTERERGKREGGREGGREGEMKLTVVDLSESRRSWVSLREEEEAFCSLRSRHTVSSSRCLSAVSSDTCPCRLRSLTWAVECVCVCM